MQALLLALVLSGVDASADEGRRLSSAAAAAVIEPDLQTGTLLFNAGDCLPIKVFSRGPYTHVAAVVMEPDGPYVYDSMNGVGVRRLPLQRYLASQAPDEIHVLHPRREFTAEEVEAFACYLESQLGVGYAIAHHVTGKRSAEGVHCAEYVTDALMTVDRVDAEQPPRVSPSSLAEGIVLHDVYVGGDRIAFARSEPIQPDADTWCARIWSETKACFGRCTDQLGAWFLCR